MPLFWRIFLLNALVLVVATALLLGPVTVSTPVALTEAAVLAVGLVAMLLANAFLLRFALAPLHRLARTMTTTDLLRPGPRPDPGGQREVAELITAYNAMLDRLEAERTISAGRALAAQEAERHRVAQELHDEVGQTLTAVLLDLKRVADHAPRPVGDQLHFFEALGAGASGYVLKSVADRDLVEACRATMRGEPFLYPGAVNALIRSYLQRARTGDTLPGRAITEREEEILKLVAEGHSSQEIADLLVISVRTVERHRANLLQKLDLKDRLELTRYAIRVGLVEP